MQYIIFVWTEKGEWKTSKQIKRLENRLKSKSVAQLTADRQLARKIKRQSSEYFDDSK